MILPILTYPNEILKKKTQKIKDPKSKKIKELIFDMLETIEKSGNALGLAAPQIGVLLQLCVVKLDGKTHILINPKIKRKSWKKETREEGCLSFPGKFISVKRSKKITVKAFNQNGEKVVLKVEGLLARAFQHEIDHLNGILFIER